MLKNYSGCRRVNNLRNTYCCTQKKIVYTRASATDEPGLRHSNPRAVFPYTYFLRILPGLFQHSDNLLTHELVTTFRSTE
jgi:hypothetical protein